jgi:antirestriction protein ArdC
MIHATKIKTRLDRDAKYEGKEQKSMYAFEELIAELGASYLAGIAGILEVTSLNATAYLKGWHEKLQIAAQDNSDFFVFATREATKAVDYILANFVMPGEKGNDDEDDDLEMLQLEAEAMKMKLKLKLKLKS